MLILEIILTIFAWRKGWKWYSLIPGLAALFIGFIVGASVGPEGLTTLSPIIIVDVLACVALVVMIAKPKKEPPIEPPQA